MDNLLSGKKILLYTHELSYTGAPTSLLRISKVLLEYQCSLEVWSAKEGAYWKEFDARNIPVKIVSPQDILNHVNEMLSFDLAIANTIVSWKFYDECRKYIPTIWYIREAHMIPKYFVKNHYWESVFKTADELYCVSEYAAKFIYENYNQSVRVVQNCVEDFYNPLSTKTMISFPIKILMLGSLTERKGFKIAIDALLSLEEELQNKLHLSFAGQIIKNDKQNKYVKELLEKSDTYPNIQYLGEIQDRDSIMRLYEESDVVLVPSQDESCSLVALEGAMQAKPLILSENVGAKYMVTEKNGWVFPTDDVNALANIFIELIYQKEQLYFMGQESRKRYTELASMDYYRKAIYTMLVEKLGRPYTEQQKFQNQTLSYQLLQAHCHKIENTLKEKTEKVSKLEKTIRALKDENKASAEHASQKVTKLEATLNNYYLENTNKDFYDHKKKFELDQIAKSSLFDNNWYKSQHPEATCSPEEHYWSVGWKNGYDPSYFFSTDLYINKHSVTMCPLVHYELYGRNQNYEIFTSKYFDSFIKSKETKITLIETSQMFNEKWYRKKYLIGKNIRAAEHYLNSGWKNGFDPSPLFSTDEYVEVNSEIGVNMCPLLHYEINGKYTNVSLTRKIKKQTVNELIIISLSSFKNELNYTRKCIRSLVNQSIEIHKIVLTLNNEEFPFREKSLPIPILDLCKKYNIKIVWASKNNFNTISLAKKLYPNAILITVNNLSQYPENWLKHLYQEYSKNPKLVYCYEANKLIPKKNSFVIAPEQEGNYSSPSFLNLISGKTVLYPLTWKPDEDESFALKYAPHNSNLWCWKSCVSQGFPIQVLADNLPCKNSNSPKGNLFLSDEFSNIIDNFQDLLTPLRTDEVNHNLNKTIKLVVPARPHNIEYNGDYHYAMSLKNEFERRGYHIDLRLIDDWYKPFDGKYVIVLRGPIKYNCLPCHYNIMWNISHPEDISLAEYDSYDIVFVASKKWTAKVNEMLESLGSTTIVRTMLQCTDAQLFGKDNPDSLTFRDVLFCGMRHPEGRKIVEDLLPTTFNFSLYGPRWEGYIPVHFYKGNVIPNNVLPQYYHYSAITLNDTRPEMRINGFVSNRIFDILAAGGFAISDYMDEINEIFGDTVITYDGSHEDLENKIEFYIKNETIRRDKIFRGRQLVLKYHTFKNRVDQFLEIMKE